MYNVERSHSSTSVTELCTPAYEEGLTLLDRSPPLQETYYPLLFIQGIGLFDYPKYFFDERDGTQQVLCTSLSTCAEGVMHYIWRVYWNQQLSLVLMDSRELQQCGPAPFKFYGYLFDSVTPDRRAVWRVSKLPNPFVSPHIPVTLYAEPQLEWFDSNNLAPDSNLAQPSAHLLPDPAFWAVVPGCYANLSRASSVPTQSIQDLGASNGVSVATGSLNLEASRTEVMRGFWDFFSIDRDGYRVLAILNSLKTQDDVKEYVASALTHLDKSIREVRCSICKEEHKEKEEKSNKLWNVKPSNLERHIWSHLGIKGTHFLNSTPVRLAGDLQTTALHDMRFLVDMEPPVTDPTPQAEYMPLDTSYDPNFGYENC